MEEYVLLQSARLVGKCLVADTAVKARFPSLFAGVQVGVGTRSGAEAVVKAVQTLVSQHCTDEDRALLKVDFKNAFNCCSRSVFLEEIDKECRNSRGGRVGATVKRRICGREAKP